MAVEIAAAEMGEASYEARKRPLESDLPEQIEVRVHRERRRRWTAADKLRIVEEGKRRGRVLVQIVLQCESANSQPFEFVGLYRSTLR